MTKVGGYFVRIVEYFSTKKLYVRPAFFSLIGSFGYIMGIL